MYIVASHLERNNIPFSVWHVSLEAKAGKRYKEYKILREVCIRILYYTLFLH